MILPIVAYGHPVLKKVAEPIDKDYPELSVLISDMYETLAHSEGVGLAAPQINKSIRLFIVDANPFYPDYPEAQGFKRTFINPQLIETFGEDVHFKEGCLSLPGLSEDVVRKDKVRLHYFDENFEEHEDVFEGICSRIIQHEYDHLEGHVYVDRLAQMRKMLLGSKLRNIAEGKCNADYKMTFFKKKTRR